MSSRRLDLEKIYLNWFKLGKKVLGFRNFRKVTFADCGIIQALLAALLFINSDAKLVDTWYGMEVTASPSPVPILMFSAILFMLNGLIIHLLLAGTEVESRQFTRWAVLLRFLIAGIPIWGLFAIPLWRVVVNRYPSIVIKKTHSRKFPQRESKQIFLPNRLRYWPRNRSSWVYAFWIILNSLSLFLPGWLPFSYESLVSKIVYTGSVISLHVISALALYFYTWETVGDQTGDPAKKGLFNVLPVFFLIPLPGLALMGLFVFVMVDYFRADSAKTLAASVCKGRSITSLANLERKLAVARQPTWRSRVFPRDTPYTGERFDFGEQTRIIRSFSLVKIAFLPIEAAPVGWYLARLENPNLEALVVDGFGFAATAALLVMFIYFLEGAFRPERRANLPFPSGSPSVFFAVYFLFFCGLLLGTATYRQEIERFQAVFIVISGIGGFILVAPMIINIIVPLPQYATNSKKLRFIFLFVPLGFLFSGESGPDFENLVIIYPVVFLMVPLLGIIASPWLIKPLDYGLVRIKRTGLPTRIRLLITLVSALTPMGGVAAPLWIEAQNRRFKQNEVDPGIIQR